MSDKEKGRTASRSKEALAQKEWEVAFNFVNVTAGNKAEAYRQYYREHDIDMPVAIVQQAHKFFNRQRVKDLIEQFRAENREAFNHIRDENIATLRDIASTASNRKSDRIAAVKELNSMCGFNQQNINVDSKTIVIEFEEDLTNGANQTENQ